VAPGSAAAISASPTASASLAAGRLTRVSTPGTIMAGLDCAEISSSASPSLRAGITGMVTVDDADAADAVRELAAEGLAIGESGAAPLAALRSLLSDPECALRAALALGPASRALLVATEGPTAGALA
jgi:diaminopropionate ammonia-lyase